MTSAELAIVAALGASALTGLASLGVVWFQEWRRRKASDQAELQAAVTELLTRSMAAAMKARTVGETMKLRSGLKEGFDIAMRNRKPLDPMELHDWMAADLVPLSAVLSAIWVREDQEGVRLANDVVNKCNDLLGASTARLHARNARERMQRWAVGEKWTPEMVANNDKAMEDLALARKRYAEHARKRLGAAAIELFTQAGPE